MKNISLNVNPQLKVGINNSVKKVFIYLLITVYLIVFQFGKNDAWDPISISDDSIIVEAFTQEDGFTQRITASLNRFNGKLLVRYDGYFEDYGNSIFSDLHFCSLTPGEQQF